MTNVRVCVVSLISWTIGNREVFDSTDVIWG